MPLTEHGRAVVEGRHIKPPTRERDYEYLKAVSCELVFAWEDATLPAVRSALERVMHNVGLDRVPTGGWEMASRDGQGTWTIGTI